MKIHYPDCPVSMTEETLREYSERGFVVFENALSPEEVSEAREALTAIVRRYTETPDAYDVSGNTAGKSSQAGTVFRDRGSRMFFQLERGFDHSGLSAEEIEGHIRKYMWFEDAAPIFQKIYRDHPRIQGAVTSILGESVEIYQSMALVKPPRIGIDKPWHQDNAYFAVEDLDGVIGTWIALDDSTVENGCMHFIPGGHRRGPLKHHHTYDCEILPDRIDTSEAVSVELPAGGLILFHGNIPHYTPSNRSNARRRALQYHYRKVSNRVITPEAYYDVFKETDGTFASCAAASKGF